MSRCEEDVQQRAASVRIRMFCRKRRAILSYLVLPIAGWVSATASTSTPIQFASAQNYGVGGAPNGIATADFNHDGIPDLVVVNSADDSFSYLQGTSNGSFLPAVTFSMKSQAGANPSAIAVGDFNRDGNLDVAIVHPTTTSRGIGNKVSVHLGNGQGGFGSGLVFATGNADTGIATADFNGDGILDLAIGSCASQAVFIHTGNGNGTFTETNEIFVGGCSGNSDMSVTAADLNGDGHADLVVSSISNSTISVLLGNGAGGFTGPTAYATGPEPTHAAVGDFDQDGHVDLAVASASSATVTILKGNGAGAFSLFTFVSVGSPGFDIETSDLNGDRFLDLIVPNYGNGSISVLAGDGTGNFPNRTDFPVGASPLYAAIADFNGDASPDIAVSNNGSNTVSVLLNETFSGSLAWNHVLPTGPLPSPRADSAAIYSPGSNRMVIFGGSTGCNNSPSFNDTWRLSNANGLGGTPQWTQIFPAGPTPRGRRGHSAVYNTTTDRMIVFGGDLDGCDTKELNETWVLENASGVTGVPTWVQLFPTGPLPPSRADHVAVYDQTNNRMTIFQGFGPTGNLSDVWVLINADGSAGTPQWTKLSPSGGPPSAKADSAGVYDPVTNHLTIFAGWICCSGPSLNEVWTLSNANGLGGTPVWTQLAPTGSQPSPRVGARAIYKSFQSTMVNFGGSDTNESWALLGANGSGSSSWHLLNPAGPLPPPRGGEVADPTIVYDPVSQRIIIFGGAGSTGLLNDTWAAGPT